MELQSLFQAVLFLILPIHTKSNMILHTLEWSILPVPWEMLPQLGSVVMHHMDLHFYMELSNNYSISPIIINLAAVFDVLPGVLSALNDVVDISVINGLTFDDALDSNVTDADGVNLNANGNFMLILLLLFAARFPIITAVLPNLTYLYLQY